MAGVEAELQKQRRYGNFMSNGVTVSEEVQNRELPGIFDDILGRSKVMIKLFCYFVESYILLF